MLLEALCLVNGLDDRRRPVMREGLLIVRSGFRTKKLGSVIRALR